MKIFISYSTENLNLVREIAEKIKPHAEVFYWDESKDLGAEAWTTIFKWIDNSDMVLTIITGSTVRRAMAVGQEIGRAKAMDKTIIPLVADGLSNQDLGCLQSITYQSLTNDNLQNVLQNIESKIIQVKISKESQAQLAFILGGIFLLLVLSSGE